MKVILKSNRKTVEFIDGITQINANDVMWQFFKIKLEVPLALRESLWVTFKNQANDEEFTHPFLASLASTGEYYAQIPADVIRNAGVWEFQLFIRQYSTNGTGKYVQYASNKYTFTVEQGLPVSALNAPVDNATISALFRTSKEIIKRFYGVKNVMTAYAKVHAYQGVKIKNVTGCALIDWGDGTIEDGNGKTNTIYSHTYTTAGNYAVRLFNVTNIGEGAFEEFSAIYDLELNNSLLSIGKNAFKSSLIDKLCIPMSVEYLADCFTETDLIRAVELKQYDPSAFNHNAFKHFLLNLPFECKVVVPTYAVDAYTNAYITEEIPMMFSTRASTGTFAWQTYIAEDGAEYVEITGRGTVTGATISIPAYINITPESSDTFKYVRRVADAAFAYDETITSFVGTVQLKEIGANAFEGCTKLKTISSCGTIEVIGPAAFYGCTAIQSITRNTFTNLKKIGRFAFSLLTGLTTVSLNNKIEEMGDSIFEACSSLASLEIPFVGENINSLRPLSWLFYENIPSTLTKVTISNGNIVNAMFEGLTNLTSVLLGKAERIPATAFCGCTGIKTAYYNIPIDAYAFCWAGVTTAYIHNTVGVEAFYGTPLKTLTIYGSAVISDRAFGHDYAQDTLLTVNMKSSTPNEIGADIFYNRTNIRIIVPRGSRNAYVNANGWSAYSAYIEEEIPQLSIPTLSISAEGLATWYSANASGYVYEIEGKGSVTVNSSVRSVYLNPGERIRVAALGDGVNYLDSPTTEFVTYEAVNILAYELVNNTYYKVAGIGTVTSTDVSIPTTYRGKAVKAIGANAFENNATITSVFIPQSITEIAENAFSNCSGLTTIDLPASIVYVGAQAFSGTSISTLDLPSSIQTIARNAFNTETLKTVNVVSYSPCHIEENAFGASVETIAVPYGTSDLYKNAWTAYADVIQEVEQAINYELSADGTYYIVTGTDDNISATLNIPDTYEGLPVKEIKSAAFDNTQFEKIYLPSTLTTIGANAFYGCPITTITIPANVSSIGSAAFANCVNLKTVEVQAVMPPAIGVSIFANDILLEQIIIPEQSLIAYNADNDWKAYSQFFPNYNQGGGDGGGNGDSGDGGGNEGGGNDDEDDGGGGGVVKPLQTLSIPIVTITSDGLAMWYAENATAYEFVVDGSIPVMTTATQMQLMDGQSVKVRAIGDGITYGNSAYSEYYLYNAVIYDGADKPILPEYSDVDITRNVFDRYAFISELEEVNNQKEFDEVHERIDDVEKDVENRVEKTKQANKLYGTDKDGNQTTYPAVTQESDPTVPAWAKQANKPTYSYDEITNKPALFSGNYNDLTNKPTIPSIKGLATESYVNNASAQAVAQGISSHNVDQTAHKDIRNLISELSNRLNAIADSDDTTLDQLSEIVAYIKANKALIESVTTSKVNVSDIVNDLETNVANKPLSASQGVALKTLINALEQSVSGLAENAVNDIGSQVVEETNELTIELKDKNGKVIATTKVTLPTQEIPEVDLSDYVKNTDRNQFVKDGVVANNISLTDDEKASVCDWVGAMPKPFLGVSGVEYVLCAKKDSLGKYTYTIKQKHEFLQRSNIGVEPDDIPQYLGNIVDKSEEYANMTATLYVPTPRGKKQAANKEYVDNLVGDIESVLTAILGV